MALYIEATEGMEPGEKAAIEGALESWVNRMIAVAMEDLASMGELWVSMDQTIEKQDLILNVWSDYDLDWRGISTPFSKIIERFVDDLKVAEPFDEADAHRYRLLGIAEERLEDALALVRALREEYHED